MRGFWLGEVDDGAWRLWRWWTRDGGMSVVSSCRRRVADGGDTRRRALVAGERKRENESERVREREGARGLLGSFRPDLPLLFVSLFFFFGSINIIQLNPGPVPANG